MPTFVDELNRLKCSCGIDDGMSWVINGNGNEITEVGDYFLRQSNSGVVVEPYFGAGERYIICAYHHRLASADAQFASMRYLAVFDPDAPSGSKLSPAPAVPAASPTQEFAHDCED